MDWISFITTMFSLGCDVTGYVGLVITPEQYKQITGKDYVAPVAKPQAKLVSQIVNTQSPKKSTMHKKSPEFSTFKMLNLGFSYGRVWKEAW